MDQGTYDGAAAGAAAIHHEILVRAAEQLYGSSKGQEKLSYVEAELEQRGYQVDTAAIEAAARAMNLESGWIQGQAVKPG